MVGIILNSCQEDYLDRYPLDEVSSAIFFQEVSDLNIYLNQYYNRYNFPIMNHQKGDVSTDVYVYEGGTSDRWKGTMTIDDGDDDGYDSNYKKIRSVNYFFENYKRCEADFDEYKQYVGEAHFFRAFFHFKLLTTFGDIQWIDKYLETNSTELYGYRDARNIVSDNIIADLDSAVMYLSEEKTDGCSRLNKWIALLLQSRVALYEGTWEKYHEGDPFGVSDPQPEKYLNKVVEATTEIMNSGLYDIYSTGLTGSDYFDLFGLRDYSSNKEIMFWTKMDMDLSIHTHSKLYRLATPYGYGLTKSMVDAYLCTDGYPISVSPLFQGHDSLLAEKQNRDPRFSQTIFTPGEIWKIEEDGDTLYWEDEVLPKLFSNSTYSSSTGYIRRKDYNPYVIYHDLNFEETPSIQYRYAEVLLNYIEAKAELGTITQADIDATIKKLRDRVGMPNLELSNITTDPDWEFPDLSPIINEVRRERKIELVLENHRWDDIARWAAADEIIVGKRPKGAIVSQFPINPGYPTEDGFIDVFQVALPDGYGFIPGRNYLDPIPPGEVVLNPNLGQNPGW